MQSEARQFQTNILIRIHVSVKSNHGDKTLSKQSASLLRLASIHRTPTKVLLCVVTEIYEVHRCNKMFNISNRR
jgi:hypothetical protein